MAANMEEAAKAVEKAAGNLAGEVLNSNSTINDVLSGLDNLTGLGTFAKELFGNKAGWDAFEKAGYYTKNAAGKITEYNVPKIAGAYLGISAGARILSGGGIYRDKNGNANLIGVPFF